MRRAYIRPLHGLTVAAQVEICERHGVKQDGPMYVEKAASFPQQRKALIESLRLPKGKGIGDEVVVSDLTVLATSRVDLRDVRRQFKAKRATILEGRTGRKSTDADQFADMIQDAIDHWSRAGKWTNAQAKRVASLGGKALARSRAKGRPRLDQCRPIWHDKSIAHWQDALDKINAMGLRPVSRSWCYRKMGSRF